VTPVFSKDLADLPGKEGLMLLVEYSAVATRTPIHRHNAHGFIYVLEGSIVMMQVRAERKWTLTPGQTFYEGPDDVHVVGRTPAQTKPAKFVVFSSKTKPPLYWCLRNKKKVRKPFGPATNLGRRMEMSTITVKRRYDHLLQGLGRRTGHHVFPRLATMF